MMGVFNELHSISRKIMPNISKSEDVTERLRRYRILSETQEIQRDPTGPAMEIADGRVSETNDRAKWFQSFVNKPLGEFLCAAYQFNAEKRDDYEDTWKSELFWFVWLARGHSDLAEHLQKPLKAANEIERVIINWSAGVRQQGKSPPYGFDKRHDAWSEWFGMSRAEAMAEFCDVWEKSRYMPGHGPLEQAVDAARRCRLSPSKEVMERRPIGHGYGDETDYCFFLSIAGHLQTAMGHQPIKLPCHKLAGIMNVSAMTVSRYRRWAQEDGYLRLLKAHKYRSKGRSDATEFEFATERWNVLDKKM